MCDTGALRVRPHQNQRILLCLCQQRVCYNCINSCFILASKRYCKFWGTYISDCGSRRRATTNRRRISFPRSGTCRSHTHHFRFKLHQMINSALHSRAHICLQIIQLIKICVQLGIIAYSHINFCNYVFVKIFLNIYAHFLRKRLTSCIGCFDDYLIGPRNWCFLEGKCTRVLVHWEVFEICSGYFNNFIFKFITRFRIWIHSLKLTNK